MDYVSEASATKARSMARKFQYLRPEAGVIFIGVQAVPSHNGLSKTFEVRLGVTQQIGRATGEALVRYVLREEIDNKNTILVSVYPGISGAAHDAGDEESDPN